jgi:methionyl-tRNA formyltransferase
MSVGEAYVVAGTGRWTRRVFDERLATRSGRWTFASGPAELTADRLRALDPAFVFLLHWSWKVPSAVVQTYQCVGFHMTDLPYGRGGSPLQNLILRGHRHTVLTAFRLVEAMDAGPVYFKAPLSLDGRAEDIYLRASMLAADLIDRIIAERPTPTPQEGEVVEFVRRVPADSRLPEDATPEQLYDFIRMLDADGYPRAFVEGAGWRCEFSSARLEGSTVRADARLSPAAKAGAAAS